MKTILFQLTILMTCCILSGFSYADEKLITIKDVDSSVVKHIGAEQLTVLFNAKKIESYRIDWAKEPVKAYAMMIGGKYLIADRGDDLNAEQSASIKKLIASAKSYGFGWTKRTLLRPSFVLRFIKDAEQIDILIDLNSLQWGFFYNGKLSEQNISKEAMPVLEKLFKR